MLFPIHSYGYGFRIIVCDRHFLWCAVSFPICNPDNGRKCPIEYHTVRGNISHVPLFIRNTCINHTGFIWTDVKGCFICISGCPVIQLFHFFFRQSAARYVIRYRRYSRFLIFRRNRYLLYFIKKQTKSNCIQKAVPIVCSYDDFPCRHTCILQKFSIFASTNFTFSFFRVSGSAAGAILCFRKTTAKCLAAMGMRPISVTFPCHIIMPFGGNFYIRYFYFPICIAKQPAAYRTAPVFYASFCKTACLHSCMVG